MSIWEVFSEALQDGFLKPATQARSERWRAHAHGSEERDTGQVVTEV